MIKKTTYMKLIIAATLAISTALALACNPPVKEGDNGTAKPSTGLNPVVAQTYADALETMKQDFSGNFFWWTPSTIASEALRKIQTKSSISLRADYNGFIEWVQKSDDPLGLDIAALSLPPFEIYEMNTTDAVTKAKLFYCMGKTGEIAKLFWDSGGESAPVPVKDGANIDGWAVYVLAKSRFVPTAEDMREIAALAAEADKLEPGVRFAVIVKNAIEMARAGATMEVLDDEIGKVIEGDQQVVSTLCHVLRFGGRRDEADNLMAGFLRTYKDDAPVWTSRAAIYIEMGQPAKAREYVTKAFESNSRLGEAWVLLATTFSFEGRFEEALDYYEQSFDMDPYQPLLYPPWANMLMDMGRVNEARDRLDMALEYFPNFPEVRAVSGRAFLRTNEVEKALEEFKEAARLAPQIPYSYLEMAKIYIQMGDTGEAASNFSKAIALGTPKAQVEADWGRALIAIEHYDEAVGHLEEAAAGISGDAALLKDLAKSYRALEMFEKAAKAFEQAVAINTYDGESAVESALCYAKIGNLDQSLVMLDKAVFAQWIDTEYIVRNFPPEIQERKEFANILSNMNPQFGD